MRRSLRGRKFEAGLAVSNAPLAVRHPRVWTSSPRSTAARLPEAAFDRAAGTLATPGREVPLPSRVAGSPRALSHRPPPALRGARVGHGSGCPLHDAQDACLLNQQTTTETRTLSRFDHPRRCASSLGRTWRPCRGRSQAVDPPDLARLLLTPQTGWPRDLRMSIGDLGSPHSRRKRRDAQPPRRFIARRRHERALATGCVSRRPTTRREMRRLMVPLSTAVPPLLRTFGTEILAPSREGAREKSSVLPDLARLCSRCVLH